MKKGKLAKLILAEIVAGGVLAMCAGGNAALAATTYDYLDGQWQSKEAEATFKYTSKDKDITDWAVPVFDKNGKQVLEIVYIPEGEKFLDFFDLKSGYEMLKDAETGKEASPLLNQALVIATKYWADVINTKNTMPLQLFIVSHANYPNANAGAWSYLHTDGKPKFISDNILSRVLQEDRKVVPITKVSDMELKELKDGDYTTFGQITVGDYIGCKEWDANKGLYGMRIDVENMSHLPSSEGGMDMIATLNHEMTHALGLMFMGQKATDDKGHEIKDFAIEDEDWSKIRFNNIYKFNDQLNSWEAHLMDQNGNMAKPSLYIAPSATAAKMVKESEGKLKLDDFFIIDNMCIYSEDYAEGGKKQPHADTPFAGKAFFVGDNVSQLLHGAEAFKTPVAGVYGISVNTWEPSGISYFVPELAHTALPILMSHNMYRNLAINTELELAIMKDIGYDIDIRNQYGRSVYGDNLNIVNKDVYFARNAQGTAYLPNTYNDAYLGVGLHVFGSHNNITQKGNILTNGLGSVGVRVDGVGNTTTVAKGTQISADGINGIGVLQSYGNSHELNVEGTVTADHETGNAVRFDFGANMLGSAGEYRGSYIRYQRENNSYDGRLYTGKNLAFDYILSYSDGKAEELNGSLVNNFNLSGSISGGKNAIYIGKNAFVENINVLEGASITGNITSDWKDFAPKDDTARTNFCFNLGDEEAGYVAPTRFSDGKDVANEAIMLQYQGKKYAYASYIPDLVTNLNINADLAYKDNIMGKENMRLNLNSGTFAFEGSAEVTKVTVAENAVLQGGTFKLNNMTGKLAEGFSDDNTGKLVSKGMISATLPSGSDTVLSIEGDVVNEGGTIGFIGNAGKQGRIIIDGSLEGEKVLAVNPNGVYLPGDSYDVSDLVTVNGEKLSFEKAQEYKNGVLKTIYSDNLTQVDFAVTETLKEVKAAEEMGNLGRVLAKQGAEEKKLLVAELFKLEPAKAGKALKAIKGQQAANLPVLMQQNNLVRNALGMRLSQVDRASDIWAKVSRNKGAINAASDYKTDAYSLGWDKQISKDWHFGFFGSYSKGNFEAETIHNDLEDYRLGVYGGYHKGAAEAIVYADYGWGRNKLQRSLSGPGMATKSDYDSSLMELGTEYKYKLQQAKTWHVAPYGAIQLNRYSQKAYEETGVEPFNQKVGKLNNTYAGLEAGVDLERRFDKDNSYGFRLGYKRGLTGVEPKQSYHYAADPEHHYINYGDVDKNKLVLRLNGQVQTAPNWSISGEAGYERGRKSHGYSGELVIKHTW